MKKNELKSGIVRETNKKYHGYLQAISKSRLSKMSICPAYFKWCEENPQEPTEDLVFGSAFHKVVLEPATFDREFAVLPLNIDRRTKAGRETYNEFLESHKNKDIITQEQFETALCMKNAVEKNKIAKVLLKGKKETSMYYVDDLTGIECKIRPDLYTIVNDRLVITDFKSCKNASPEEFTRDIIKYSYDLQVAMYKNGASKVLGYPLDKIDFVFIAVEKKAPHLIGIYEANEDIYQRGDAIYRKYLGMLKHCRETNDWYEYNGITHQPMLLGLPEYLKKGG